MKPNKYLPQDRKLTSTTMAREMGTVLGFHTLSKDIQKKKRCSPVAFRVRRCRSKGGRLLLYIEINMHDFIRCI